jgi:Domain of unknown function (DUF5753)
VALIGGAALHLATISGEVMREQIDRLIEVSATSPNTVIRILPLLCGAPSYGPATILRFAEA